MNNKLFFDNSQKPSSNNKCHKKIFNSNKLRIQKLAKKLKFYKKRIKCLKTNLDNHKKVINKFIAHPNYISIEEALDKLKLKNNTYLRMKKLFQKYRLYIDELNSGNTMNISKLEEGNQFIFSDLNNVISFVNINYINESTRKRRKEQLRQIIRLITGNPILNFNANEHNKNTNILLDESIDDNELKLLFKKMKINDEVDAIVIFQFVLHLGLNISQISKLRLNNIKFYKNKSAILKIKYNGKFKQRTLSENLLYNLEILKELGELNKGDFIFFNEIKNINNNSRNKYIHTYVKNIIDKCDILKESTKEKLYEMIKTERKQKRIKVMNSDEESIYKELNNNQENPKKPNDNDDDSSICRKLFESDLISNIDPLFSNSFFHSNSKRDFGNDLISGIKGDTFIGFDINNSENTNGNAKDVKINDLIWGNKYTNNPNSFENINYFKNNFLIGENIENKKALCNNTFSQNISKSKEKDEISRLKFLNILKECKIDFIDEAFFTNDKKINDLIENKQFRYGILKGSLLDIYKNTKKLSENLIYPNIEVIKVINNVYRIEALYDINQGTLLFEVGGRVVTRQQITNNEGNLQLSDFCYYFFLPIDKQNDFLYILIQDKGNIAFFLKKADDQMKNNVVLKIYLNEETKKICLLCISCRKIKKGEILIVNNKFTSV